MKAEELFGVFVRTMGVVLLYFAFRRCVEEAFSVFLYSNHSFVRDFLRPSAPDLVLGILFTFFADWLVGLTYRRSP